MRKLDLLSCYQAVVAPTEGTVVDVDLIFILGLVEIAFCGACLCCGAAIGNPEVKEVVSPLLE